MGPGPELHFLRDKSFPLGRLPDFSRFQIFSNLVINEHRVALTSHQGLSSEVQGWESGEWGSGDIHEGQGGEIQLGWQEGKMAQDANFLLTALKL